MKIAICGLGKMGMQIAEILNREGHEVVAYNRSSDKVDAAKNFGATPAYSREDVINAFSDQQIILWVMIPSSAVDGELEIWKTLLKSGDVIIDGGNSNFNDTKRRALMLADAGIKYVDVGTSGGILGLKDGFSMMVGGDQDSVELLRPILDDLSKPIGGWQYFGEHGSGHYVKMVHNAIEYGMMESLAEGYRVLKEGPYKNIDLVKAGTVWEAGSIIKSSLNKLTAEALQENPSLEGIDGFVAESGEARWTIETADAENLPLPSIKAAFNVRLESQRGNINFATKLLAAMRNKFGGHAINPDKD